MELFELFLVKRDFLDLKEWNWAGIIFGGLCMGFDLLGYVAEYDAKKERIAVSDDFGTRKIFAWP